MACNSCSKSFSFLRQEKGCPGCGFSYCSKCLNHKVFLQKLNSEAKVCAKCKNTANTNESRKVEPPDAYYKRIGSTINTTKRKDTNENAADEEIYDKLMKLKKNKQENTQKLNNDDIINRLKKLKGDIPSTSTAELEARLANIKGVPVSAVQTKLVLPSPDLRTEQEQANDLLKQYMAQTNIDAKYKDEFDELVSDIEIRLQKLKGSSTSEPAGTTSSMDHEKVEDEDEIIKKIIEKDLPQSLFYTYQYKSTCIKDYPQPWHLQHHRNIGHFKIIIVAKVENKLEENEICDSVVEELPFCEICNEDAKMRCLGCKYLFCKQCFLEHKDDDDGCNKYEPYIARKTS